MIKNSLHRSSLAATAALLSVALYVGWLTFNMGSLWLALPLLILELVSVAQLLLLVWQTSSKVDDLSDGEIARRLSPNGFLPEEASVVVTGTFHTPDELERTLAALRAVESRARSIVAVQPGSTELIEVAQRFGVEIEEVEGNHSDAFWSIANTLGVPFVAWLEAGQIPFPDFLTESLTAFVDPSTAVVQSNVGLINTGSFSHLRNGRDENAFRSSIVYPTMGSRGVAPWAGGGSVIRVAAVQGAGGVDAGDKAALSRALVRLQLDGWQSRFITEPLVRSAAPNTLGEYLMGRRRAGIESLRVFRTDENPLRKRGLSRRARLAHISLASTALTSLRHAANVVVLTLVLVTGALPFSAGASDWIRWWVPAVALPFIARILLARGTMRPGDWVRQSWRTLAADLSALGAVAGRRGRGEQFYQDEANGLRALSALRPVVVLMVGLELAVILRGFTLIWPRMLPRFSDFGRIAVLALAIAVIVSMASVLRIAVTKKQRRKNYRLETDLPGRFNKISGTVIDISTQGLAFRLTDTSGIEVGDTYDFDLLLDEGNLPSLVFGRAVVRSITSLDIATRVGVEFVDLAPEVRAELVEYCAVHHHQDEFVIDLDELEVEASHPVALRAVSGVAVFLGALTLLAGPGAAPALADVGVPSSVCVQTSTGAPRAGGAVRFHYDGIWNEFGTLAANGCAEGLLPDSTTPVEVIERGVRAVVRQDPVQNPSVVFTTQPLSVTLGNSQGAPLAGGQVRFSARGWKDFGTTDAGGTVTAELLPVRRLTFSMTYQGARVNKVMDTAVSSELAFSTVAASVSVQNSEGGPLSGAQVSHHASGWKVLGTTDASGVVTAELLGRRTPFSIRYGGLSVRADQDIVANPNVSVATKQLTVTLVDSAGQPLAGGVVSYAGSGWNPIGTTDAAGETSIELLAANTTIRVVRDGVTSTVRHNVGNAAVVGFSTRLASISVSDSTGAPIQGARVQHYAAPWRELGVTGVDGTVEAELLPGRATFRAWHQGTAASMRQNLANRTAVDFVTVKASFRFTSSTGVPYAGNRVEFSARGWKPMGTTDADGLVTTELFPSNRTFRVFWEGTNTRVRQNLKQSPNVVFTTKPLEVVVTRTDGSPLEGVEVALRTNRWIDQGRTGVDGSLRFESLPGRRNHRLRDDGVSSFHRVNVANTSRLDVQTGLVLPDEGVEVTRYFTNTWRDFPGRVELLPGRAIFRTSEGRKSIIVQGGVINLVPSGRIQQLGTDTTLGTTSTSIDATTSTSAESTTTTSTPATSSSTSTSSTSSTSSSSLPATTSTASTTSSTTLSTSTSTPDASSTSAAASSSSSVFGGSSSSVPTSTSSSVAPTSTTPVPPTTNSSETTSSVTSTSAAPTSTSVPETASLPTSTTTATPTPDGEGETTLEEPEVENPEWIPQTSTTAAPSNAEDVPVVTDERTELDPGLEEIAITWRSGDVLNPDVLHIALIRGNHASHNDRHIGMFELDVRNDTDEPIPAGTTIEFSVEHLVQAMPLVQEGWECVIVDDLWSCTTTVDIGVGDSLSLELEAEVDPPNVLAFRGPDNGGSIALLLVALLILALSIPGSLWISKSRRRQE